MGHTVRSCCSSTSFAAMRSIGRAGAGFREADPGAPISCRRSSSGGSTSSAVPAARPAPEVPQGRPGNAFLCETL